MVFPLPDGKEIVIQCNPTITHQTLLPQSLIVLRFSANAALAFIKQSSVDLALRPVLHVVREKQKSASTQQWLNLGGCKKKY